MKEPLFNRLLNYFHIDEEEYQKLIAPVSVSSFAEGHSFKDIDKAVALVKTAINNKDKIFIYGDYDADGIMATSIIAKSLLKLGIIPSFYIPNRYNDGYGITLDKAKGLVTGGFKLVICVDNGVSALEAINYLKDNNVNVLVLDHHTIPDELPKADYIIHPSYSEFGETPTSAGFVSFMFSWALLGYFDKYLSTLAAISIISDMMPLKDYNRNFLRLVFTNYRDGDFYALDLLKEGLKFDENAIGMKIAPKINALGRLLDDRSINDIVRYFVTGDKEKINRLYEWIVSINEQRKQESKATINNELDYNPNEPSIILLTDAKEGMLGLLANAICSEQHKPVVIFAHEKEEGVLKGSCRAPQGFNVVDAFNSCGDIMLTAGGHALAGGCSINEKDLELFKERFNKYVTDNPLTYIEHGDIELGLTEINSENCDLVLSFSPFGEGWKAPSFLVRHIKTDSLMYSKTNEHIISFIGEGAKLVGFNMPKNEVSEHSFIDVTGILRKSYFKGRATVEFNIKDYQPCKK